uniref:Uncharacterized protein n=1 Tax=Acrobeloides nanus TaxID=290746 RepID=A0A914EBY6_9BILA
MVRVLGHPMAIMMWNNTEMYKYIPGFRSLYYRIVTYRDHLFGFFEKQVEEHQANVDLNSEPTDYVDAYLREKAKRDQEIGENGHFYK